MDSVFLISAVGIAFAAVLLFAYFIYWYTSDRQEFQSRELSRRIGAIVEKGAGPIFKLNTLRQDAKGMTAQFEDLLRQAGSPYDVGTLYRYMMMGAAVGVFGLLIPFRNILALAGVVCGYVPVMLVERKATQRSLALTEQLPDSLDLLARSLQAGHGISEGFRMVAEEAQDPIATEFNHVYEENNLGRDFRECLQNLTKRNPRSFDLQLFSSSVLLQRDTGGNLVEILQNISGTIRERFTFAGKVAALTAEARFTAYILGGLPFVIGAMISFTTPTYLAPLFNDTIGNMMLLYASGSFGMGVFVMREVSKVEI